MAAVKVEPVFKTVLVFMWPSCPRVAKLERCLASIFNASTTVVFVRASIVIATTHAGYTTVHMPRKIAALPL
eukprot:1642167-Pleurochrysis_carterae.AAC.1